MNNPRRSRPKRAVSFFKVAPLLHGFALGPGGPHHRNAAASGANKIESLSQNAGAPPKAAYAVIGVFFLLFLFIGKENGR
jgi:hypothetical protein